MGVTTKAPANTDVGLIVGVDAKAQVGPISLFGAKIESKMFLDNPSFQVAGNVLWTSVGVKLSDGHWGPVGLGRS